MNALLKRPSTRLLGLVATAGIVFVLLITTIVDDASLSRRAGGGETNTDSMIVSHLGLTDVGSRSIQVAIEVESNNEPVSGAFIRAKLQLPSERSVWIRARSGSDGRYSAKYPAREDGTYTLAVIDVKMRDMTFNENASVRLETSVTIGSPEPPTATPTEEPAPPTATATEEPVPPTATPTDEPAPPTATPTNPPASPTPTDTPDVPTATATEPSPEPSATATATQDPASCNMGNAGNTWHPPSDHEHGDAPPQAIVDWSCATFGHTVIYGGDEGTANENEYKHRGFGGMTLVDDGVTSYIRTHMMTTPLGRSGPCHSYEVYSVKNGVVVGFWQGWISYTDNGLCDPARQNLVIQCEDSSMRPIIKAAQASCGSPPPFENWYANNISWSWDIGINSEQTTFADGDPQDPSTWIQTGDTEPTRRIEAAWYQGRTASALAGAGIDFGDWFCANNLGDDIQQSATPNAPGGCAQGYLDQWISPDMTSVQFPGNSVQKTFNCPNCTFPNH